MTAVRPTKAAFAAVVARDLGRCAACGHEVSGTRGYDFSLHHRRPAGMGGDRRPETHSPANLVLLHGHGTAGCHHEVETHRADAINRGLLLHRSDNPADRLIEHAVHGWTYLTVDGGLSERPAKDVAEAAA